ncbi:MAG: response regulator [Zetaproteobacteria bacterium CG2_30_46_52]|nr:MAG: response regulator [Zetaproteobacteria bacterium CG2_30_46_52]
MTQKVLVVDDARVVRISLGRILKKLGFEIIEAENGKEAYEAMNAHPDIALVMLDWNMPVMNGYEFLVAMREQERFSENPRVIMVTTETGMPSMLKALAAGADEYIMKPFDESLVCDKLDIVGIAYNRE